LAKTVEKSDEEQRKRAKKGGRHAARRYRRGSRTMAARLGSMVGWRGGDRDLRRVEDGGAKGSFCGPW